MVKTIFGALLCSAAIVALAVPATAKDKTLVVFDGTNGEDSVRLHEPGQRRQSIRHDGIWRCEQ